MTYMNNVLLSIEYKQAPCSINNRSSTTSSFVLKTIFLNVYARVAKYRKQYCLAQHLYKIILKISNLLSNKAQVIFRTLGYFNIAACRFQLQHNFTV